MSAKEMLSRALDVRQVLQDTPGYYHVGLCRLIPYGCADREQLETFFLKWPEFSGSIAYPVPAPKDMVARSSLFSSYKAYIYAFDNLPKYTGEYGAARLRLLDFIISELEKENG